MQEVKIKVKKEKEVEDTKQEKETSTGPGEALSQKFGNILAKILKVLLTRKPAFGLDISDHSIEVLQLKSTGKVENYSRVLLESGVVKNGQAKNQEKLIQKIQEAIKKAGIKNQEVIFSVPESQVFVHYFENKENIKERARKTIPWEEEKIYSEEKDGLYIAAPKIIVDEYLNILRECGLTPLAFETESLALARALKFENSLVVDLGARITNLSIFDEEETLKILASVPTGGEKFTKVMAEKMETSFKEARKLIKEHGLKKKGRVADTLKKELQPVIKEIKNMISFYKGEVDRVFLVGGASLIPGVDAYFSQKLNLEVEVGRKKIIHGLPSQILFNTTIGLALRGLEKDPRSKGINLLPQKERPETAFLEEKLARNKFFQLGVFIWVLSSLAFLGWVIYDKIIKGL